MCIKLIHIFSLEWGEPWSQTGLSGHDFVIQQLVFMSSKKQRIGIELLASEWTRAQPAVAAFISSQVPRFHDAEDLLQQTAMTVASRIEEYDQQRPFVAWAIGFARVEVLRFRQRRGRERVEFNSETVDAIAVAFQTSAPMVAELRGPLRECLHRLTDRIRQVVSLHYLEGLSAAVIAKRLERSENNIFVSLHRARRMIRECVEKQHSRQS